MLPRSGGRPGDETVISIAARHARGLPRAGSSQQRAGLLQQCGDARRQPQRRACADPNGWTLDTADDDSPGNIGAGARRSEMGFPPNSAELSGGGRVRELRRKRRRALPRSPLFLFPPEGSCATYTGTAGLHSVTSPLSALQSLPGKPLDAGAAITVAGHGEEHSMPRSGSTRRNYWAVMGGHAPVPGAKELPLFLTPGDYQVHMPGGCRRGRSRG